MSQGERRRGDEQTPGREEKPKRGVGEGDEWRTEGGERGTENRK